MGKEYIHTKGIVRNLFTVPVILQESYANAASDASKGRIIYT